MSNIQAELKKHEQWLIDLRQDSSMNLTKIQAELKTKRNVTVNRHHLEIYFRNLGQRKNLSRHEWGTVLHTLDSLETSGRTWDLYISGRLITKENVRKKRKYAIIVCGTSSCQCPADVDKLLAQLPDKVTIRAHLPPDSSGSSLHHGLTLQPVRSGWGAAPDGAGSILPERILASNDASPGPSPIMSGTAMSSSPIWSQPGITSIADQTQFATSWGNLESHLDSILGLPRGVDFDMSLRSFEPHQNTMEFGMDGFTFEVPSPFSTIGQNGSGVNPHIFQLTLPTQAGSANESIVFSSEHDYAASTSIISDHRFHEDGLIESARLLAEDSGVVIPRRERRVQRGSLPTAEELLDDLQSLVSIDTAKNRFLQLFFYSVVNNFAGIDDIPIGMVITFSKQHEPARSYILKQLRNEPTSILSYALAERLFEAAINACDASMVRDLLALKIFNPNDIICAPSFARYNHATPDRLCPMTPIEKASHLRNFDVVKSLLDFGAEANKSYGDDGPWHERGGLECAIRLSGEYRKIDIELVDLLLNHGATVRGTLVHAAIRWGDTSLIEKLMSKLPESEHEFCYSYTLCEAAEYLTNDMGLRVIQQVMTTCRDTHGNACIDSRQEVLGSALVGAARRKNHELVNLLLPYAGQEDLNSALTAAAQSGSHSVVFLLMSRGASPDFDGPEYATEDKSTPLAEAIRCDDTELVDLFANAGAWNPIERHHHLQAAMCAIAESGNSTYLLHVLKLVPNPDPSALALPLFAAIGAGHEEIALKLIASGANVNWKRLSPGPGPPLLDALRIRNSALVWAILEQEVEVNYHKRSFNYTGNPIETTALEAATAWGDRQVITALVFMGAEINVGREELPLSIAIKAGDSLLFDLLINLGADPNVSPKRCSSPLAAAASVQDAETANYLLDHGADPADVQSILTSHTHCHEILDLILQRFRRKYPKGRPGFGGGILHHAVDILDGALLDKCLSAGFDVNSFNYDERYGSTTALGLAVKKYRGSRLTLVSKLLKAGADVNQPASETRRYPSSGDNEFRDGQIEVRQTAFLDAIETKSVSLVELLIQEGGAKVTMEAKLGLKRTPLQMACDVASHTIVDLLLQHKADVHAAPAARGGATALQLAAKAGSTRIAETLLVRGADVNTPGVRFGGRSAIEFAAEYGRLNMIQVLYDHVQGNFATGQYESAIALAQEKGHRACAILLRNLSSGRQGLIGGGSIIDGGIVANVVS